MKTNKLPDAVNCSPDSNFTRVPNDALRDPELSFKAKGLLACLLSNKEGWTSYTTQLLKLSKGDGVKALNSGLQELEEAGYLIRLVYKDSERKVVGSFFAYTNVKGELNLEGRIQKLEADGYTVAAPPRSAERIKKLRTKFPSLGLLFTENPNLQNPNLQNPNLQNPNLQKGVLAPLHGVNNTIKLKKTNLKKEKELCEPPAHLSSPSSVDPPSSPAEMETTPPSPNPEDSKPAPPPPQAVKRTRIKPPPSPPPPKPKPKDPIKTAGVALMRPLAELIFSTTKVKTDPDTFWPSVIAVGKLVIRRGVDESRILTLVNWLHTHYNDPFVPTFYSVFDFVDKFTALERAMLSNGHANNTRCPDNLHDERKVNSFARPKHERTESKPAMILNFENYQPKGTPPC